MFLREWRNWQTRTFEGRVVLPYGFDSRFPHQTKRERRMSLSFCLVQETPIDPCIKSPCAFDTGFAYPTRRSTSSLVRRRVWVYSPAAKYLFPLMQHFVLMIYNALH